MNSREIINKMVSIAQLYYLHNLPRSEIAQRLGMSRQMVSKLLDRAQEEGLVEIKIVDPFNLNNQLSKRLCDLTGLEEVIVVPSPKIHSEYVKRNIGLAGADYLLNRIKPGNVIGLGWGITLNEMIKSLQHKYVPETIIVPMVGGLGRIEPELQVNNLAMLFSQKIGSTPLLLYAPTIIESESIYASMLESASSVIEYWDKLDIAIIGIGVCGPEIESNNMYSINNSYTKRLQMQDLGAVGDIGMHFFDINGNTIATKGIYKISMDLEKIKKVPLVIGMAGGLHKLKAIQGAIMGHYIKLLITDEYVAQELLLTFSKNDNLRTGQK
jgi:DNA-binding transcriptional regulator LsrR (DeoR family)